MLLSSILTDFLGDSLVIEIQLVCFMPNFNESNDNMTELDLDELDRQMVQLLTQDARIPLANLARKLGVARSTAQARMERLERRGHITGYTVRLGEAARNRMIRATVLAMIEPRALPAILPHLKKLPAIEVVHTTTGRFDLAMQVAADTTQALDRTLDQIGNIDGVRDIETLIHLSTRIDRAL